MVFFTINLYNFILFILNNIFLKIILKHHRQISRRIKFAGIVQRVEKYLLEMPQTPTSLQIEIVRRYFTKSWKRRLYRWIWSVSILPRVEKYFCICHDHRWNICVGIFPVGIFFCAHFPSMKPSVIFFPDKLSDGLWYYRRKRCRRTLSVGDLVSKKCTDEVWISYRRIRSVGKTVKSCN